MPIFHGATVPKAADIKIPRSSSSQDETEDPGPFEHLEAAAESAAGVAWSPFGGAAPASVTDDPTGDPTQRPKVEPAWILGDDPVPPPSDVPLSRRDRAGRAADGGQDKRRRSTRGMTPTAVTAEMTFRTAIIINRLMLATAPDDDAGRKRVALQVWAGLILGIMQFVGTRISMTEIITIVTRYALEADANGGRIPRMPIPAEQVMALLGEKILEKYHDGR